jgi:hypothetical protein
MSDAGALKSLAQEYSTKNVNLVVKPWYRSAGNQAGHVLVVDEAAGERDPTMTDQEFGKLIRKVRNMNWDDLRDEVGDSVAAENENYPYVSCFTSNNG